MKHINFFLEGFGFKDFLEFKQSTFGFITPAITNIAAVFAIIVTALEFAFGFSFLFLVAYVLLIAAEWVTGILASSERGEKHESRKLGRMLLKIFVYSITIIIPNAFQKESNFPEIAGFEVDPFLWLYWIVILVIIWQLFVSLLENLEQLNFKFARVLLKVINKKFHETTGLNDEYNDRIT